MDPITMIYIYKSIVAICIAAAVITFLCVLGGLRIKW